MTFETCQVNGYKFSTTSASGSGIVVKGTSHENNLDYYGQLQEIMRLTYDGYNHVYLFKCIWFDSIGDGVRMDKDRVVTIDITSRLRSNEIFILASQASQVYYAPSVLNPRSKIYTVVKSKSRPIDESVIVQNDIEDAFQEDRSNAGSFSLFVDFAQYGRIPFIRHENQEEEDEEEEDEDEEDEVEDKSEDEEEEDEEGEEERGGDDNDDDEDDDGFDEIE